MRESKENHSQGDLVCDQGRYSGSCRLSPAVSRAVCWHRSCRSCHEGIVHKTNTEAVLLVDASNAFNSLNRQAALHNIRHLCPLIVTTLINTYRDPTSLFINGFSLLSQEATRQGVPLPMPMYAIATIPSYSACPTMFNKRGMQITSRHQVICMICRHGGTN